MTTTSATSSIDLVNAVIDVQSIVDALIQIDSAPIQLMQNQTSTLQSQISAYQSLNTNLATLQTQVDNILYNGATAPLITPGSFAARLSGSIFSASKATSSNTNVITATAGKNAANGTYSIAVGNLAKARTDLADGFLDSDTTLTGTGTLSISIGGAPAVDVTIDSTNNTLQGVAAAINAKNAGVNAAVINDGSAQPYRLVITSSQTGIANSFTITDNLTGGKALNLVNKVAADDAKINVNGIDISRSSNTISDVISGATLNLVSTNTSPTIVTVGADLDSMVSAMKNLVSAYNAVNSAITSQTQYNTQTKTAGVLSGDSNIRDIKDKLQSIITGIVSNSYTTYSVLSQVGVNFNRDGSLSFDESAFRSAASSNLSSVAALFLGNGAISDSRVTYNSQTPATQAGTYNVQVTGLATQAAVTGSQTVSTLSQDENLTITYGSSSPVLVSLASNDTIDAVLQKINAALSDAGVAASAVNDGTGAIKINSSDYGSSQSITVVSDQANAPGSTGFGTTPISNTGTDIAGTINGHAAVGSGRTLTGANTYPEEGLSLTIAQTTTGSYGSIAVTDGSTNPDGLSPMVNLQSALENITDPLSGPIQLTTDAYNQEIKTLNDRIAEYQSRLDVERQMLTTEYNQADQALRLLTLNQASLSAQTASLSNMG
jgi:flagellar hook-associated protein 2